MTDPMERERQFAEKERAMEARLVPGAQITDEGDIWIDYGCHIRLAGKDKLTIHTEQYDFIVWGEADVCGTPHLVVQVPSCPCGRLDCTC